MSDHPSPIELRLPAEVRSDLDDRIADTEFDSIEEYVRFVLCELVDADDRPDDPVDESAIEARLEHLGYL